MAQSNYTLANKSAPASRAKINDVFQSIATNNSGSSEPSTTFPHQWWYDTTTNILKQRNAADSAWINIGTLNQSTNAFEVAGLITQNQATWEAGTSTTESIVSPAKVKAAVDSQFNVSGSAPKYACRAWVNFDGTTTTPTIRASGNVSSVTRGGAGQYTINFTTAISDANYSVDALATELPAVTVGVCRLVTQTTTSVGVNVARRDNGTQYNPSIVTVSITR